MEWVQLIRNKGEWSEKTSEEKKAAAQTHTIRNKQSENEWANTKMSKPRRSFSVITFLFNVIKKKSNNDEIIKATKRSKCEQYCALTYTHFLFCVL